MIFMKQIKLINFCYMLFSALFLIFWLFTSVSITGVFVLLIISLNLLFLQIFRFKVIYNFLLYLVWSLLGIIIFTITFFYSGIELQYELIPCAVDMQKIYRVMKKQVESTNQMPTANSFNSWLEENFQDSNINIKHIISHIEYNHESNILDNNTDWLLRDKDYITHGRTKNILIANGQIIQEYTKISHYQQLKNILKIIFKSFTK